MNVLTFNLLNVGPISAARVQLREGNVTLVAGQNEAGKSSLATAVRALMSRVRAPLTGTLSADGPMMLAHGTKKGSLSLETHEGSVTLDLPKLELSQTGEPPEAVPPVVSGLHRFGRLEPKARSQIIADVLKAEPTVADLASWLRENAGTYAPPDAAPIFAAIKGKGWEAAGKVYADQARSARAVWENATGEKWGQQKAEGWVPDRWRPDLAAVGDVAVLEKRCNDLREQLEGSIAAEAVGANARDQMTRIEASLTEATAAETVAAQEAQHASAEVTRLHGGVKDLPAHDYLVPQPCPSCGTALAVDTAGKLVLAPKDAGDADRSTFEAARQRLEVAREQSTRASGKLSQARGSVSAIKTQRDQLAARMAKAVGSTQPSETLRAQIADLERDIAMVKLHRTATDQHATVMTNRAIALALAPEGVRLAKLRDVLVTFNHTLAELSELASLEDPIRLADDMAIWRGPWHYAALSESAKFMADAILQSAIAVKTGAPAIVVDAADVLDTIGRNGLLSMLVSGTQLAVLVTMTFGDASRVPNLAKAGLGDTLWLEDGTILPVATGPTPPKAAQG